MQEDIQQKNSTVFTWEGYIILKRAIVLLGIVTLLLSGCAKQLPANIVQDDFESATLTSPPQSSQAEPDTQHEPPSPSQEPEGTDDDEPAPQKYTYEVRAKIHEIMPEYRFVASGEEIFVLGLDVYDEKDTAILSVPFEPESCPVYPEMMDTMGLHVTDVNFDGYKDVIILNCFHGAHGNSWYDCWLWNNNEMKFEHSESFVEICNPALDPINQCIYSTGGAGASYHRWDIYKFIDGEFVVSNSLSFESMFDSDSGTFLGIQVTEEALVDGKLQTVHSEVIKDAESFYETKYNDDPLWQLSHPHWYGVGGHHADQWLE